MTGDWSDEETTDPLVADARNFYKVEKWARDNTKVDSLFYAGNNLDKARNIFAEAVKHRPRIRLTIRQRTRILDQWPRGCEATEAKLPYLSRVQEVMRSPEEYRKRAKEARKPANACRNEYERQGLLIIADQCERIAAYQDLTDRPSRITAPPQADPMEAPTLRPPLKPGDGSPDKQQAPIILSAKP